MSVQLLALISAMGGVDGSPGRKLVGEHAPRATAAQDVEDGIHDFASLMDLIGGLGRKPWNQRFQQGPLLIREIGWIGIPMKRLRHAMLASFHLFCSFS